METDGLEHKWRDLSEEILLGMEEWRRQHPKATLWEIEAEVSKQMSRLGARMIQEVAQRSPATDWTSQPTTQAPRCPHCQSDAVVRNGHALNGKQLYRCRACGRQSRENPTPHAYPPTRREEILQAYQERSSLRGLTRTFGVSRTTVSSWIQNK